MLKDYKWKFNTVNQLHIELSTYCNAACPMCPRTVQLSDGSSLPNVRPDLILESISIDDDILRSIEKLNFQNEVSKR